MLILPDFAFPFFEIAVEWFGVLEKFGVFPKHHWHPRPVTSPHQTKGDKTRRLPDEVVEVLPPKPKARGSVELHAWKSRQGSKKALFFKVS